jgi:hypothetical protein
VCYWCIICNSSLGGLFQAATGVCKKGCHAFCSSHFHPTSHICSCHYLHRSFSTHQPFLHAEHPPHLPHLNYAAHNATATVSHSRWAYSQFLVLRSHRFRNSCLTSRDLSYLSGAVPWSLAQTLTCVVLESSEVEVKCTLLTAPSCKTQILETWFWFRYTFIDSNEFDISLPPWWVCYVGRVVWFWWVTYGRECDVINHNFPEDCL